MYVEILGQGLIYLTGIYEKGLGWGAIESQRGTPWVCLALYS